MRDFERFGMRQSKINFHALIELSKIAREEKLDFNEDLDTEYCSHRKEARGGYLLIIII